MVIAVGTRVALTMIHAAEGDLFKQDVCFPLVLTAMHIIRVEYMCIVHFSFDSVVFKCNHHEVYKLHFVCMRVQYN